MKITLTKLEIPYYMVGWYFTNAQKMVEDLAPTACAEKTGSILTIWGDDAAEVRRFADHVIAMSPYRLKETVEDAR